MDQLFGRPFTPGMLQYGQVYHWKIGFNDTAGNIAFSEELSFNVSDSFSPDVEATASQTTSTPEYNSTVNVSILVTEPINASGVDTVWISYTNDNWVTTIKENITISQTFTFTPEMLVYDQSYLWMIGYNDTAGNTGYSNELTFLVIDSYNPDVIIPANQTTAIPEFNGTVEVSIQVDEPAGASGVDTVSINYTVNNWISSTIIDITATQKFIFTPETLEYPQTYQWIISYNDTEGNAASSNELTFMVMDSFAPDITVEASQSTSTPEYNGTDIISILVTEPIDASGVDTVWIIYTNDSWVTTIKEDITISQTFTFTPEMLLFDQLYYWKIGFNDTIGNLRYTNEFSFSVIDSYVPDVITPPTQTTSNPEYNGTLGVFIQVFEPNDASGLDKVWIHYTINNWVTYTVADITPTQNFSFTGDILEFGESYQWFIRFRDNEGNTKDSRELYFTVIDSYAPDKIVAAAQTTSTPNFNDTVEASIQVNEPGDASGIDTVWINHTSDNWQTYMIVNITTTQKFSFTEELLKYNQTYRWIIGYNDSESNTAYSNEFSFAVIDTYAPSIIVEASQTTSTPEFNGTTTMSIQVTESSDSSGVDTVWINYTLDSWQSYTAVNIGDTQSFTFTEMMLEYNQTYQWRIGYNDTVGNTAFSKEFVFTVIDSYVPDVTVHASQTTSTPQFNDTVEVSIQVNEPTDASGVDTVWMNYTLDNWQSYTMVNISETQNFTFTEAMLEYLQTYQWRISYNDTAGNTAFSEVFSFTVIDSFVPDVTVPASQTTSISQFNDTVEASIWVTESKNASGIDTVWMNYTLDNWQSYTTVNISETQMFTFTETMLEYNQTYQWRIGYNDTAGNAAYSEEFVFTVIDSFVPDVIKAANQTTTTPEYDENNTISITVSESSDASGIDTILLKYQINKGSWIEVDVTTTSNFTFTEDMLNYGQVYDWFFFFNDTAGNSAETSTISFTVVDKTALEYSDLSQTSSTPEYNGSNTVSVVISDPDNASEVDTILLYYSINSGPWIEVNVTLTSNFTFTPVMLRYNEVYEWYFTFNDTAGNNNQTTFETFTVIDSYLPDVMEAAIQTSSYPEFNDSVSTSISVEESFDASGLDIVWMNYTISNWNNFTVVDISGTQTFTFTEMMLEYDQKYQWRISYNDTAGNMGYSNEFSFTVIDTFAPDVIAEASQTTNNPEFNDTVEVSIQVIESPDASGVDTVWINYTTDDWNNSTVLNITQTQSFTFSELILEFGQTYRWKISYNDSIGNSGDSIEYSFTVIDSYAPDVITAATQSTTIPEYNSTVIASIQVSEPMDASGLDRIWIHYTFENWFSYSVADITATQSFTFTEEMLKYGQNYQWFIRYRDLEGNTEDSSELSFTVIDSFAPDVSESITQTTSIPEFNGSVTTSIDVYEPTDAAGLDKVWINYTVDNWLNFFVFNITPTRNFTFNESILEFNQVYLWVICYNDSIGNTGYSQQLSFTVIDSYAPDVITAPTQTTSSPEYNETVDVLITISEPDDAAGLDSVWINYTIDFWNSFTIEDISLSQTFTFTETMLNFDQTYIWQIWFNDTADNTNSSNEFLFFVGDSYEPDVTTKASQITSSPEYNGTVIASITVFEPSDAAGLDTVWINYTLNNWKDFSVINITETQTFIFTEDILKYNQSYSWFISYNDSIGNMGHSEEVSFTVVDSFVPDVISAASQSTAYPEFNGTVIVSINVNESPDASGVDTVWINYTTDSWDSFIIMNITSTQVFTFSADTLEYGDTYQWILGYNDTVGNTAFSDELSFDVVDSYVPDVEVPATQSTVLPEFNTSVETSITVTESIDAAGLDTVWINYTVDDWATFVVENISSTQSFTFTASILQFNQIYKWKIMYNDTENNIGSTDQFSFTVIDSYAPDVIVEASQTTSTPEYNDTVEASIQVTEPIDASGVDTVWINVSSDDWFTFTVINITSTQKFIFTDIILKFNQTYRWIISYNDTTGNTAFSEEFFFTVIDSYAPDVIVEASQTTSTPNFNDTVEASIQVTEPIDASGLDTVWINYTKDNWINVNIENITQTQSFIFTAEMLKFNQIYQWVIGYNDSLGNTGYSKELSFMVVDSYTPDVLVAASQTTSIPEYNGSVITSIQVNEPSDASGLYRVWIHFTIDNWTSYTVADITTLQTFTFTSGMLSFNQTYQWMIRYRDAAGNTAYSKEISFTVIDSYAPDVTTETSQTTSTPEFNSTVTTSIQVTEPGNACGVDTIWINYTNSNWDNYTIENITSTQTFTFTEEMIEYSQIYLWVITYNDTIGNTGYSDEFTFEVVDSYVPDVIIGANQNTSRLEFNNSVIASIQVAEPGDASGVDKVWINYTIDNWLNYMMVDITSTQDFTFNEIILVYGQIYQWTIGYNDTAGNIALSEELSFEVIDSYAPDVVNAAIQSTATPEFNGSVTTSVTVIEPKNASGIDTIWINYTIDNWDTFTVANITTTQTFIFTAMMLKFNQTYRWIIGYNDTAGNKAFSEAFLFSVIDSYAPDIEETAQQTTATPEYDGSNNVSIVVSEPSDAAGVDTVLFYYSINSESWIEVDVTSTSYFIFTEEMLNYGEKYDWRFWFNDTEGNSDETLNTSFYVYDYTAPTYSMLNQTTDTPEYNGSNTVSVNVTEPIDATGVDTIILKYRINSGTWIEEDVTATSNFTFTETILDYGEVYDWRFWFNDTEGNSDETIILTFTVTDSTSMEYTNLTQTSSTPEYNGSNIVSVVVSDPGNASGVDTILLYYRVNTGSWVEMDVTSTSNFIFTPDMLIFDQIYTWYFWFNDTAGNNDLTMLESFTVIDSYISVVEDAAIQTTATPEFNGTVTASIFVTEPIDASGVDTVWINYTTNNWVTFTVENITLTQSYTFSKEILTYGQFYRWKIGYNDIAGNSASSEELSFSVIDTYTPDLITSATQTTTTPEYNGTVVASITVSEPGDASGIDTVWIKYSFDNWATSTIANITETQTFSFTDSILFYNQTYQWVIFYNDTSGNTASSEEISFSVFDTYTPDLITSATQTTTTPEYNGTVVASITVSEPGDASGIDTVWINYTIDNWNTFETINITETQAFIFTDTNLKYDQIYRWIIAYNDTAGNTAFSNELSFTVVDNYSPDVNISPNHTTSTPEFNSTVVAYIAVSEPSDAAGVDTIWINYTSNNWLSYTVVNISETQDFTFTESMLIFSQTYRWVIGYNDTIGNNAISSEFSFVVIDSYAPDVGMAPIHTTSTPQFNGSTSVSLLVTEPTDASGVDTIWINYTIDNWQTYTVVEITTTQSFAFNDSMLVFGQVYKWKIGYNDTVSNIAFSNEFSFEVIDIYQPEIVEAPSQGANTPEYYEYNTVSITVSEEPDASGVDKILLYYRINNGSWIEVDCSATSSHIFTNLIFGQIYEWYFWFNDTANNRNQSEKQFFNVIDNIVPTFSNLEQTSVKPEYDEPNTVSVTVSEPPRASGVDTILLYYRINFNVSWIMVDATEKSKYTFNEETLAYGQIYDWYFWFNDSVGNSDQTPYKSFHVVDNTVPIINQPFDLTISEGTTGVELTWSAADVYPSTYIIYQNGSNINSGTWNSSIIYLPINELLIGDYNYTLVVFDQSNNLATDMIWVTVVKHFTLPSIGDWIIQNHTIFLDNDNLTLNGNLLILTNGILTLRNVTLYMTYLYGNQSCIEIFKGGSLTIEAGSSITSIDSTNSYQIKANNGCSLLINSSSISYSGNASSEFGGLWINTDGVQIINCNFTYNYYPLILDQADNCFIEDNTFTNNYFGIHIRNSSYNYLYSNRFINNSFNGITLHHSTNNVISGNQINNVGHSGGLINNPYSSGSIGTGIYLYYSNENSIYSNSITDISGGIGEVVNGSYSSGGVGSIGTGIYLINSHDNYISSNTITDISGGIGGISNGSYGTGGVGGIGTGIYLSNSTENRLYYNRITDVSGGIGGAANGTYGTGGVGGIGTGIYLSNSTENLLLYNYINDVMEAIGGYGNVNGTKGSAFGIFLETNSFNNYLFRNRVDYDFVIYLFGQTDAVIEGYTLTAPSNPTNLGKIALINCHNITVMNNIIENYQGATGATGASTIPGYLGESGVAIFLLNSENIIIKDNNIKNIKGGTGGTGGYQASGGPGGAGIGIYLLNSTNNIIENNIISDIIGGIGGTGGYSKLNGPGGNSTGIYLVNSSQNSIALVISDIKPGLGNPNGNQEYLKFNSYSENNIWIYHEKVEVNYDLDHIVFFGAENITNIDSLLLYYRIDDEPWTIINLSASHNYMFYSDLLFYGQTWECYYWINETSGNSYQTPSLFFVIIDIGPRLYSDFNQTNSTPEYDGFNTIFIVPDEPEGSSGIDTILFFYQVDDGEWTVVDVTTPKNYTFTSDMLAYAQVYKWYFQINDSAGNLNTTGIHSFTVVDNTSPTYANPTQTNTHIGYDETNTVEVNVIEPDPASGVETILLNYQVNNGSWIVVDVSDTSSYIFTADILSYSQDYDWYFWFSDTAGNSNLTAIQSFTIIDTTAPTYSDLFQQNTTVVEGSENPFQEDTVIHYYESNFVSIDISEPEDASGVDTVLLYYHVDNNSWILNNVSHFQNYTFTANMLSFGQVYEWYFWFNDTAGNYANTSIVSFTVIDTIAPVASRLTKVQPEYDNDFTISITLIEPVDASGIDNILFYHRLGNNTWTWANVSSTSNYTFDSNILIYSQSYDWYFWFNDTAGNSNRTTTHTFTVTDNTPPVCYLFKQDISTLEYDKPANISVLITEPMDASGVDEIYFYYKENSSSRWFKALITQNQSFSFEASLLEYGQVWVWYFWYNDTAGNNDMTLTMSSIVQDFNPPSYSNINQTDELLKAGENNTVSLDTHEPEDASGVDQVWIKYRHETQGEISWNSLDITESLSYTFNYNKLSNGTYYWFFEIYDKAGNFVKTPIRSFEVITVEIEFDPIIPLGIFSVLVIGSFTISTMLLRRRKNP
ncbi:MAG: right-handed parallel beta-helix repeat-containing protein [Candidatus Hodarchaeales archaeon]|jgi:parallel beta-helix repeat protein